MKTVTLQKSNIHITIKIVTNKLLPASITLLIVLLLLACNPTDPLGVGGNCSEYINAATAFTENQTNIADAQARYDENPNAENCQNLKNAHQAYIDLYESLFDCAWWSGVPESEKEVTLQQAREDLDNACDE